MKSPHLTLVATIHDRDANTALTGQFADPGRCACEHLEQSLHLLIALARAVAKRIEVPRMKLTRQTTLPRARLTPMPAFGRHHMQYRRYVLGRDSVTRYRQIHAALCLGPAKNNRWFRIIGGNANHEKIILIYELKVDIQSAVGDYSPGNQWPRLILHDAVHRKVLRCEAEFWLAQFGESKITTALLKCRSHVIQDTRLNRPRGICSPEVHYPRFNPERSSRSGDTAC